MNTVLLVEDDASVRTALVRTLSDRGFQTHAVGTAAEALREIPSGRFAVVVLDLGLPDLDGATLLRMIRAVSSVPVIVATARADERSVVDLLNGGADDYVVKPFAGAVLEARIRAQLRRATPRAVPRGVRHTVGGLEIDLADRTVLLDGETIDLTRREFDLLAYLAEHAGRVVTRRELLDHIWAGAEMDNDQTIDVHVSWLRRKLGEDASSPRYVHTIRGVGLKLAEPP